jgi:CDGSH-type Zn-finger protein
MPETPKLRVTDGGPYVLEGEVPIVRTAQVETEYGEPVDWAPDRPMQTPAGTVRLCRCGASLTKPFCDDACDAMGFDGEEVADHGPYEERRYPYEGDGLTLDDDLTLCTQAGYCGDRFENVWAMIERAADPATRERIRTMSRLCPSGRIRTRLPDEGPDEPDLPVSIAAIEDGPLWVRGGIEVVGAEGEPYEVRNRQTLCRCGSSGNKPFCDGTHNQVGFKDG